MKRLLRQGVKLAGTTAIGLLILPASILLLAIRFIWNAMDMFLDEKGDAG